MKKIFFIYFALSACSAAQQVLFDMLAKRMSNDK